MDGGREVARPPSSRTTRAGRDARRALVDEGYRSTRPPTGSAACTWASPADDVLVIDRLLPALDGLDLLTGCGRGRSAPGR